MKQLTVFTLMLLAFSGMLIAQGPGGPGGRMTPEEREAQFQAMVEELQLTETQQTEIKALQADTRDQMRELRESGATREEMFARMMELREENDAWMQEILTEEQYVKFQAMQEERRQNRPRRGRGGPGGGK